MTVLAAETTLTSGATGWQVVVASLVLVAIAMGLAGVLRLGIGRDLIEATVRAAIQLVGVGLLFVAIFGSASAIWWAWLWVAVMVAIATVVVHRRAGHRIPGLVKVAGAVVALTAAISIGVIFGFGVFELDPVSLVVVAGITIGNAVPSAVLGVKLAMEAAQNGINELEALLALGLDRREVIQFMAPRAAKSALIPQIERTKVVGLIALPGAMTGLLLAGVEPVEAVVVQLLVMYLVLGTAAVCVVALVVAVTSASIGSGLRVADWVRPEPDSNPTV